MAKGKEKIKTGTQAGTLLTEDDIVTSEDKPKQRKKFRKKLRWIFIAKSSFELKKERLKLI